MGYTVTRGYVVDRVHDGVPCELMRQLMRCSAAWIDARGARDRRAPTAAAAMHMYTMSETATVLGRIDDSEPTFGSEVRHDAPKEAMKENALNLGHRKKPEAHNGRPGRPRRSSSPAHRRTTRPAILHDPKGAQGSVWGAGM